MAAAGARSLRLSNGFCATGEVENVPLTRREDVPRGIVAERHYGHSEWHELTPAQKRSMAFLLHVPRTRPHFVAYRAKDLPSPGPWIARNIVRRPLLAWTVCTEEDRQRAKRWANQMIFEGFKP